MIRRGWILVGALALAAVASPATARAANTCSLGPGGQVKHVVVLQFDNTHLARDAARVPSDLEQMPALKGFLEGNGTLLSNDHTILISHTAGGIVSTETGLYPDRNGLTVTNSYEFFDRLASSGVKFSSAFKYWTDPTGADDPLPTLITTRQKNTPAPWVGFTRAGLRLRGRRRGRHGASRTPRATSRRCSGPARPRRRSGPTRPASRPGRQGRNLAVTDLEGIAVHCSPASSAPGGICADGGRGRAA